MFRVRCRHLQRGGRAAAATSRPAAPATGPLDADLLDRMQRYWSAANYLTVGQIYLQDNPLLREPLRPEHIKPRLLGHWGTSPGLSFMYVAPQPADPRARRQRDLSRRPGTRRPGGRRERLPRRHVLARFTRRSSQDVAGLRRLFRQFSTPGGIPSHVSVPTPGSIHEGGELGYVLAHAFGAAFDNPDLIVAAVVGDGEAETGPLAGSWKSTSFLNPARDGAVLPILHLNGYKISGPTVFGATSDDDVAASARGHGYDVHFVAGDDPARVHQAFAATLDACYRAHSRDPAGARAAAWRRTSVRAGRRSCCARRKGGRGRKWSNGQPVEGTFRAHQVPLADVQERIRTQLALLEAWMRSYEPETTVRCRRPLDARAARRWRRAAIGAWAPTRTPTADGC